MKTSLRIVSIGMAACCLTWPALAEVQRIAADGTSFRADIETLYQAGRPTGTAIRLTRQRAQGGKELSFVPGTDDAAIERDPAMEVDPSSGRPVLVWSRNDGPGFNLYISRYDGTWSAPRLLVRLDGDDIQPQVRVDPRYLHVSWRQEYLGLVTYWRASFLATTLEPAFGPERIPTDDLGPFAAEDPIVDAADASAQNRYFCGSVLTKAGDPGRAYLWGVRDEPVPINYRKGFVLPVEVRGVVNSDVGFIGGRFTYWLTTSDSKLYYATLTSGRWSDFRVVELNAQTSLAEARLLLTELNARLVGGGR
jgi:hypothetical protein